MNHINKTMKSYYEELLEALKETGNSKIADRLKIDEAVEVDLRTKGARQALERAQKLKEKREAKKAEGEKDQEEVEEAQGSVKVPSNVKSKLDKIVSSVTNEVMSVKGDGVEHDAMFDYVINSLLKSKISQVESVNEATDFSNDTQRKVAEIQHLIEQALPFLNEAINVYYDMEHLDQRQLNSLIDTISNSYIDLAQYAKKRPKLSSKYKGLAKKTGFKESVELSEAVPADDKIYEFDISHLEKEEIQWLFRELESSRLRFGRDFGDNGPLVWMLKTKYKAKQKEILLKNYGAELVESSEPDIG